MIRKTSELVWTYADFNQSITSSSASGLLPATQYGVRIRSICSPTQMGVLSAEKKFTTLGMMPLTAAANSNTPEAIAAPRITTDIEPSLNVYPNPVHSHCSLEVANMPKQTATITISDLNGRTVLSWRSNIKDAHHVEQFDLADMPAGVYTLRLQSADGSSISRTLLKI